MKPARTWIRYASDEELTQALNDPQFPDLKVDIAAEIERRRISAEAETERAAAAEALGPFDPRSAGKATPPTPATSSPSSSLLSRYADGYRAASFIVSFGNVVKTVAVLAGICFQTNLPQPP